MNKCIQCNSHISDKAKYCSDKCRKAYSRAKSDILGVKSDKQPGQITPDNPKTATRTTNPDIHERPLTVNEKQGITEYGICHSCKTPVSHLICICRDCTTKDITHESLNIDIAHCN